MSYAGNPPTSGPFSDDLVRAFATWSHDLDVVSTPDTKQGDFHLAAYHLNGLRARLDGLWPTEEELESALKS